MRWSGLMRMLWSAGLPTATAAALGVAVLGLACGDGGEPADDQNADTVSNAPADAIADYIATTGLDGETFELADPVACPAIEDVEANVGKICLVLRNSEEGEATAEIEAVLINSTAFWTVALRVQNGTWVVTEVTSGNREGSSVLTLPFDTQKGDLQ